MEQEVQKLTQEEKLAMYRRGEEWKRDSEALQRAIDDFRFKYPVTGYNITCIGSALLVKPMLDNHWYTYGSVQKTESTR